MSDISKIVLPDGSTPNVKDSTARDNILLSEAQNPISVYSLEFKDMPGAGFIIPEDTAVKMPKGDYNISFTSNTARSATLVVNNGSTETYRGTLSIVSGSNSFNFSVSSNSDKIRLGVSASCEITNLSIVPKLYRDSGYSDYVGAALPNTTLTTAVSETYDRCCSKNLYNWEESYNLDNCYNVKGTYTTQGDTRTNLRFEIRLCNSSNIAIQDVTLNQEITTNGTYTWSFVYNGGATNILIGHSGSTYNGRYRQPVNDLVVGAKYYISINIVQASNSLGAFIWKDVMICTAADWNISHDYVPYNTLNGTTLPVAVKELSDADGKKNLLQVTKEDIASRNSGTWNGNVFTPGGQTGLTMTINSDGSISTNGAPSAGVYISLTITLNSILTVGETYVLSGCTGGSASTYGLYTGDQGVWDNFDGGTTKIYTSSITSIYLYVRASADVTGKVFYPMICTKAQWDISHEYQPYTFSNSTITPALIECVDSGKKNELELITPYGSGITNNPNLTVTLNSDQTITVNGSATTSGSIVISNIISGKLGKYLSGRPAGVSADIRLTAYTQPSWSAVGNDYKGVGATITDNGSIVIAIYVIAGQTYSNLTFKPMICEKSLWDVSQKYVPYAMDNAQLTAAEKTIAEYGGGINKLNPVPMFTSGQYAVYNAITNTYSETAGHLDTYSNLRFMIQACTGTTVNDFAIVSTLVNSNITQNGNPAWLFTKLSTFNRLYVGHNGSTVDCKFFFDVSNLEDNQKYYLCVNVTNYTHANNAPFTWKNVMVLSEEEYLNGWWHNYQPYAFPNVTITPALVECVDNGKKNLLNEFSLTTGAAGEISVVVNADRSVILNTNGATTENSGVRIGYFTGEAGKTYVVSNASSSVGLRVRYGGSTIVLDTFTNASFVAPDSSKAELIWYVPSGTTLTNYLLKPMVCEKALWDISQKYVPYIFPCLKYSVTNMADNMLDDLLSGTIISGNAAAAIAGFSEGGWCTVETIPLNTGTGISERKYQRIFMLTGTDGGKMKYRMYTGSWGLWTNLI